HIRALATYTMSKTVLFRYNALVCVSDNEVLPNICTPHMLDQLVAACYRGPLVIRLNPGFGHGHVQSCDTGGPSSKHGIWFDEALTVAHAATHHGMTVTLLHAHIGSGPAVAEFTDNIQRLASFFAGCLETYPHVQA